MNKFYSIVLKSLIALIGLTILSSAVIGGYSANTLDNIAYVVAIGFDTSDSSNLKITVQIAKPNSFTSSSSGTSSDSDQAVLTSVDCSSFESGINLLNGYVSRNINLSHCNAIIFSEELASKDISNLIYDLSNNTEVSSHANIIITKCNASDYLEMASPIIESFPAKYYHVIESSSQYTGQTSSVSLIDFFNYMEDDCRQPVATLGNINTDETHLADNSTQDIPNKDSSYLAGQSPVTSSNQVEAMGLSVFRDGKLIGELNGLETIYHNIVCGELDFCNIQIPSPADNSKNINLILRLRKKPKIKVQFINGYAYIKVDLKLVIRVITIEKGMDFTDKEMGKELQEAVNSYMEKEISNYLYKTSKELNSDIDGFGNYALKYFLTNDEWNKYNWVDNYKNSFFSVNVDAKIMAGNSFLSI